MIVKKYKEYVLMLMFVMILNKPWSWFYALNYKIMERCNIFFVLYFNDLVCKVLFGK